MSLSTSHWLQHARRHCGLGPVRFFLQLRRPTRPCMVLAPFTGVSRRGFQCTRCSLDSEEIVQGEWYFYDDGNNNKNEASRRARQGMHSSGKPQSNTDTALDGPEDATDDASPERQALRRRRQLYEAAVSLKVAVDEEIAAEVKRDAEDGAAAVPPLAPGGWAVQHPPGSSYFLMRKSIPGAARVSADERGQRELVDRLGAGKKTANRTTLLLLKDDVDSALGEMRFRSVNDAKARDGQRLQQGSAHETIPTFSLREPQQQQREPFATGGARVAVARSDIHITVVAPFRVQDLSFHDPTNGICEYATFDVLVRKTPPSALAAAPRGSVEGQSARHHHHHLLQGQRALWESQTCLYLRLASANSELRLRSVQFLSRTAARALEEAACFGNGDPFFNSLLARHTPVARQEKQREALRDRSRRSPMMTTDADALSSPLRRFIRHGDDASSRDAEADALTPAEALLTQDHTLTGEVARAQLYQGPYITELSKELRDALLTYVMTDLGISDGVREYICQMQYFMEQEEYIAWLARWRHVADRLQKHTPDW